MKKFIALGLLSVFLMVFCGAPEEGPATETKPVEEKGVAEIVYQTLSEVELQQFMKVFPVVKEEVEKSGKEFKGDAENWEGWIGQFSTLNKDITGLDAKLRAAGMPWDEFWPTFGKVWMAVISIMLHKDMDEIEENIKQMEAQLKDPKVPEAQKEMMKQAVNSMTEFKKIYEKVPQGNRNVVKKHWDELSKIMEIED